LSYAVLPVALLRLNLQNVLTWARLTHNKNSKKFSLHCL